MTTNIKKVVTSLLCGITMILTFTTPVTDNIPIFNQTAIVQTLDANAATAVRKGRFNNYNWTGYTYIYASQGKNWRGQWYNKTPKIKICTFDLGGWRSGGTMSVEVRTSGGSYIGTYKVSSGSKLTLKGGYGSYKVRVKPYNYGSGIYNAGRNWTNRGKCVYWSIDASNNCRF